MGKATIKKIGALPYYITRTGRVFSRKGRWKELKQYDNKDGYKRVKLYADGLKYQPMVHILVSEAFAGTQKKDGYEIDHIDRNIENNHIRNLQQITKEANLAKRVYAKNL